MAGKTPRKYTEDLEWGRIKEATRGITTADRASPVTGANAVLSVIVNKCTNLF